jgi:DNA polymerase III sliding clamp (beta) subunit (PCNA family)
MDTAMETQIAAQPIKFSFDGFEWNALNLFAAKNDVRYYLQGLHLNRDRIAATNGHVLMAIRHNDVLRQKLKDLPEEGVIIPTTKAMVTTKNNIIQLSINDIGRGTIEKQFEIKIVDSKSTQIVKAIVGKYPDIERVIPKEIGAIYLQNKSLALDEEPHFDAKYFELIGKAAQLIDKSSSKKRTCVRIIGNAMQSAKVQINGRDDIDVVLMPCRV